MGKRSQALRAIRHAESSYVFRPADTERWPTAHNEGSDERLIRRFVYSAPPLPVRVGVTADIPAGIKHRDGYRPVVEKPTLYDVTTGAPITGRAAQRAAAARLADQRGINQALNISKQED